MNLEESEIWAKACYQDVVLVSDFMQLQVNPLFENITKTSDRDVYIHGLFLRSLAWMLSLRKLDQGRDFQPIVSGARSLLETTVDLVLIHYDKTNSSGWKMRFWGASAKLKAAKAAIEYFKNRARKSVPVEYQDMENFILNEESTIESMRISLWTDTKNPTKSKHPERWTGHGRDLLSDVRKADKLHGSVIEEHLGSNLEEFYETEYRRLNWNVHGSGLTGVREVEPEGINIMCGLGYRWCARLALVCANVVLTDFKDSGITGGIQNKLREAESICSKLNPPKQQLLRVKVFWQTSGKPAEGIRVAIGMVAVFSGGVSVTEPTDESGEAFFEIQPTNGEIYINGSLKYKGLLSGDVVIYI